MTNPYQILGIDKTADEAEIKKAYRKKSMQTHPDRNPNDPTANAKFQAISEAYDILSDTQKRQMYDLSIGGHISTNPNDIFEQLFSNNLSNLNNLFPGAQVFHMNGGIPMNFNASRKTAPIVKNIELSLEKAYSGCVQSLEITRWVMGNVKYEETETLYVTIQEGIDDNEIILLKEKGNIVNENNKGDVKIFIKIINNTEFERDGLDLKYNKTITLKEALCGFNFDMKYLDGRNFKINNNNGNIISTNYKKMVNNLGMKRNNNIGNLIIVFTVIFPEKLTSEQIESLKKIL